MFKSPIVSFMGHVDAGKTSLKNIIFNKAGINGISDTIEDGGITQSISSYFIDNEKIQEITKDSFIKFAKEKYNIDDSIPGINIIDTPGHEAFSLMRQNTSKICDIAIVVIDILAGVKPQTLESIKILRDNKVPFIIVTTKLDLVDGFTTTTYSSLNNVFKEQEKSFVYNLEGHINDIKYELMEEKINCELYFKNKQPQKTYSIIPLSTKTGEGITDLLLLILYISQNWMEGKITYKDDVEMVVMNNYNNKKQGWILDVILKNGSIKCGDKFIVYGKEGAKETSIRAIYNNNERLSTIKASACVRLIGSNNSNIYTGTHMYPVKNKTKQIKELNQTMDLFWNKFELNKTGVFLVAPTMETLDALYTTFIKNNKNVCGVFVSNITDRDLLRILTIMRENKNTEDNVILYFGSDKDLIFLKNSNYKQLFKEQTASIYQIESLMLMSDTIIYHLIDDYNEYKKDSIEQRQTELIEKGEAVFPCRLKILKEHIFMKGGNKELMFGVKVMEGKLKIGTPLTFIGSTQSEKENILGNVISLQRNNKEVEFGNTYDEVCIKLDNPLNITYGRQFSANNDVVSNITRESIDILKQDYRDMMTRQDWLLVIELKKELNIQ